MKAVLMARHDYPFEPAAMPLNGYDLFNLILEVLGLFLIMSMHPPVNFKDSARMMI